MTEETNVHSQVETSLEQPSLSDLFNQLDDSNKMAAGENPRQEDDEEPVEEKAETEDKEVEASEPEDTEDKAPEKEEGDIEEKNWEEELAKLEKRFKDTQASFHKVNQANQKILEKVAAGEELTEDDLRALAQGDSSSPDAMQQMVEKINQELPIATAVVAQTSGREVEDIQADIEAFNQLAVMDKTLVEQLTTMDEASRAAFVIKTGGELREVFDVVNENGGSVVGAIRNASKVGERKLKKAVDEAYEKGKKEVEEKYKNYVSGSAPKPKVNGSAPSSSSKSAGTKPSLADIF